MLKHVRNIFIALFALALAGLCARGVSAVTTGNEWFPLQTYHGAEVHVPITKTAAFTFGLTEYRYDISTAGGAFVASLPDVAAGDVPADGQCWKARMTVAGAAASFSPSAIGDLLNGSQAAYAAMDAVGDSLEICYDAETTNYNIQSSKIN